MGITISSESHSCDMGYGGFMRFRIHVATKAGCDTGRHYRNLENAPIFGEKERKDFFERYDRRTNDYVSRGILDEDIAIFLYQSDGEGILSDKQAEKVYKLIEDSDDTMVFGYIGRDDCATMLDLKRIFSEGSQVEWS